MIKIYQLPIETVSESNQSEHWAKKHARHKLQRLKIGIFWHSIGSITLPCTIRLTRISPRLLDDDNLVSAFKHIRDCIADNIFPEATLGKRKRTDIHCTLYGRADADHRIKWEYAQEKGRFSQEHKQGIKIEIIS